MSNDDGSSVSVIGSREVKHIINTSDGFVQMSLLAEKHKGSFFLCSTINSKHEEEWKTLLVRNQREHQVSAQQSTPLRGVSLQDHEQNSAAALSEGLREALVVY